MSKLRMLLGRAAAGTGGWVLCGKAIPAIGNACRQRRPVGRDYPARLERFPFALAHGTRSSSLFESVIYRSGDSTCADHALERFPDH